MADSSKQEPVKTEPAAPADPVAEPVAPTEAAAAPVTEEAPAPAETAQAPKEDSVPAASASAPEPVPAPEASEKPIETSEKPAEPAAQSEPTKETVTEPTADKPSVAPKVQTPFSDFAKKLPDILKEVGHDEMWGVTLVDETHVPTAIILQKFLNANEGDLTKAIEQFTGALKFRKEKKPLDLLKKTFSASKFGQLGAVTTYQVKDSAIPEVFTWNFYGNVKDRMDEVFVPLEDFMDYRIALQELGIQQLKLSEATKRISEFEDPYKIIQVHDYKNEKFFVNVPAVMGWLYGVLKLFVAEKTRKKFHPMANGGNLAAEFVGSGLNEKELPKEYGGEAGAGDGSVKTFPGSIAALTFE
ncbi:putative phosphatidylinositol transfer protein sfh5 protein [Phaeoacremonium minimum UCRPA7]|uniref:Phosphatidylinositol transfer protein SFH5 n=1 Tax=Phaeoacremonium minimum (strain UCR-PA7) TaxID=1286976 RepID=R8B943_PHAM7|nr:putative phosphatidylinositol transfer protein sfh5 protein [Phaeoacremonium minimum UCRPA7]EON95823.1 putative phosphatidylinositol transfer protein sfh5 protein [Phaeoacremonium minimum UCRPA7]